MNDRIASRDGTANYEVTWEVDGETQSGPALFGPVELLEPPLDIDFTVRLVGNGSRVTRAGQRRNRDRACTAADA